MNTSFISKIPIIIILFVLSIIIRFCLYLDQDSLHFDDTFSFQIASANLVDYKNYLENNNNIWHKNKDNLINLYTLTEDRKWSFTKVSDNTAIDVHPPFYYWLLHAMMSIFNGGNPSKWVGFALNSMIFLLSSFVFYRFSILLYKNVFSSAIAYLLWSFCFASLGSFFMNRMYELQVLFCLLLAYIVFSHIRSKKDSLFMYFMFMLLCTLSILTHYYSIVFIGFMCAIIVIHYGLTKLNRNIYPILKYMVAVILSFNLSYILFPGINNHLMDC